jgi:hypothetical protein
MKVELVGGPFDGVERTLTDPPGCIWVDGPPECPRCFRKADEGRVPYFEVLSARDAEQQREDRRESFMYAGASHTLCRGCGAFHALRDEEGERVTACGLCGTSLERLVA